MKTRDKNELKVIFKKVDSFFVDGGCTFSSSGGGVGKCSDLLSSIKNIGGLFWSRNDFTADPLVG